MHNSGCEDKEFSIYCDAHYKSMAYAGDDESTSAPRYSAIVYKTTDEGQVAGIISYMPRGGKHQLYLFML